MSEFSSMLGGAGAGSVGTAAAAGSAAPTAGIAGTLAGPAANPAAPTSGIAGNGGPLSSLQTYLQSPSGGTLMKGLQGMGTPSGGKPPSIVGSTMSTAASLLPLLLAL